MYSAHGVSYTEDHSVSFGYLGTQTVSGVTIDIFVDVANSWSTWHLIPTSFPVIDHASFTPNYVSEDGNSGINDLTDFMFGHTNYATRKGSMQFYIDRNQQDSEAIYDTITSYLHGTKVKMRLMDDPGYYYEGRFSVDKIEPGESYPTVSIQYEVEPYKYKVQSEGSVPVLWDPFNFETDYDYYTLFGEQITVNNQTKTFTIHVMDYRFKPEVKWVSGTVTASFGGITKTLSSAGTVELGAAESGDNILRISGTGAVKVTWRGGYL